MAGTIKIELDIPDFNNTLGINIELIKDGRGVTGNYHTSTLTNDLPYNPDVVRYNDLPTKPEINPLPITCTDNNGNVEVSTTTTTTTPKKRKSGNMMNIEF